MNSGGNVRDEAVNVEDHTAFCGEEEPAYRGSKAEYAHRERDAQRISLFKKLQQLQPTFTKGYKVTLYSD